MNPNRRVFYFQGKKPPFYALPLALITVVLVVGVLAVFGLVIGIAVAALIIFFSVMRLVSSLGKKKVRVRERETENDGTTIILEEGDYEVIEKDKE
jgi:MFS superfamily sulfate permease-like transporter